MMDLPDPPKMNHYERTFVTKQSREAFEAVRNPFITDEVRHAKLNALFFSTWGEGYSVGSFNSGFTTLVIGVAAFLVGVIVRGLW